MPSRVLFATALFALTALSCGDDGAGTEFTLRGQVVAAQAGMQPQGELTLDEDDAARDDRGEPDRPGVMQVRVTGGGEFAESTLEECDLDSNAVRVFWTEATDFDPASAVDGDDFPAVLNGRQVDIDGRAFTRDGEDRAAGCTLLAERVQIEGAAARSAPPATAAPTAAPSPSPVEVESPPPTVTPPLQGDEETVEPDETP